MGRYFPIFLAVPNIVTVLSKIKFSTYSNLLFKISNIPVHTIQAIII